MTALNDIWNWATEHKAALAIGAGWFLHKAWPAIRANGGLLRLIGYFFWTPNWKPKLTFAGTQTLAEHEKNEPVAIAPVVQKSPAQ